MRKFRAAPKMSCAWFCSGGLLMQAAPPYVAPGHFDFVLGFCSNPRISSRSNKFHLTTPFRH
jgi:hypothetical protein